MVLIVITKAPMQLSIFLKQRQKQQKSIQLWFKRLRRNTRINLDPYFHQAHDAVFKNTDCMKCAHCCATTSPIFYQKDIDRAALALHIKPGEFIERYLEMDEEGDFVFTQTPGPFLQADLACSIYKDRPKACREYPHTNRKQIRQLLTITEKNTQVCPAVLQIVNQIQERFKADGITI